jgi:DNA-directed RNA polymerase subunit RPC12/RpoP
MPPPTGCLICGADIEYLPEPEEMECVYCRERQLSSSRCRNGHFVCDRCNRMAAEDLIESTVIRSTSDNPFAIAESLLESPAVKMHGPEHHFLVPAALIAALYNHTGEQEKKERGIKSARRRAEMIKGGSCGFLGDCGAAVGTGIFVSVVTGATPLSREEWRLANLMTARTLEEIAQHGGPRCCKRNTFLALRSAVRFLSSEMGIVLPEPDQIVCRYSRQNKECLGEKCVFFSGT